MTGFIVINLLDLVDKYGDEYVKHILSDFSCPANIDVEKFLLTNAVEFAKQGYSQTHIVLSSYQEKNVIAGYFTLANKYFLVKGKNGVMGSNLRRRIRKFGQLNLETNNYQISALLIAQLGKNANYDNLITGDELLNIACAEVKKVQRVIGGKFVYLECEDKECLKTFYETNGFYNFGKRFLDRDEVEDFSGSYLIQMLKYLNK